MRRITKESSALVFLHTYETSDGDVREGNPRNEERLFARVPVVGEYVATSVEGAWYKVFLVVHTPFEESDFDAEVYAVKERDVATVVLEDRGMFERNRR